jgi:TPR repeat protein
MLPESIEQAIPLLKSSLRPGGYALSGTTLYHIYLQQGNREKAFECMELASGLGYDKASYVLGAAYHNGAFGAVEDKEKAFAYHKLGASTRRKYRIAIRCRRFVSRASRG